ncbi:hypothetical protein HDZ31DRAFT_40686 [Schizophyllum fasciatum]
MAPSVALDAEERPSSPENDSPVRVKRAVRTYGRARPANETHATASFAPKAISPQSLVASASLSTSILRARPSESDLASDDDNEDAAAPSKFTWDWKKKLDNWDSDEGDGEQDEFANGAASENGPHDGRAAHDTPDVSLDASDLASSARTLIERSPLKQPIHSSQSSLGDSPLALHKPKPRQSRIADSDDEEQVISKPAKTSVISRDTPSDSDDELPTTVTISPRRKPTSKCQAPKPPTKDDGRSRPATRKAAASQSAKVKPSRVKVKLDLWCRCTISRCLRRPRRSSARKPRRKAGAWPQTGTVPCVQTSRSEHQSIPKRTYLACSPMPSASRRSRRRT